MKKKAKPTEKEIAKEEAALAKLVKITKLMKMENVRVAPKGPARAINKWRSQEPKFAPKVDKSVNVVQAGGMDVDPALQQDYENWRKDKEEEQNYRRQQAQKKYEAAKKAKKPFSPDY